MALTGVRLGLAHLPDHAKPGVIPGSAGVGILHIGLGAFHRAHQAVYTEDAMARSGGDWGIAAVAPRSRDVLDILREQDHLYSVTSLSHEDQRTRVIGALAATHHLPSEAEAILARIADPAVRVVTLTVTEKAYRFDDEVRADLAGRPPRTVIGLLVRGLRARSAAGGPPLAVVSCDNLPSNGERLRGLVGQATGGELGDWVAFPSTMVDRIVPASAPSTVERAASALGVDDLAAVAAEPYSQWVIVDDFPGGRPAWDLAGATLTTDVTAWERLKLRVLNGVHSAVAYLGALAGCATIADAVALPGLTALLRSLIAQDLAPTLDPPAGVSVTEYGEEVLRRIANPAIDHRTVQVAMDGTQKLPQRLVGTVLDRRRQGALPAYAALCIAAWMRFVQGNADDGRPLPLQDPLAGTIQAALPASGEPRAVVDALLPLVSPAELVEDGEVVAEITGWLCALRRHGAADTIRRATS
jgi:fructuronate reductase